MIQRLAGNNCPDSIETWRTGTPCLLLWPTRLRKQHSTAVCSRELCGWKRSQPPAFSRSA